MSKPGPDRKVSDVEILKAIDHHINSTNEPVIKATELAEQVSIGEQQCRDRLRELETQGLVASKSSGSGKVWWVALSELTADAID